MQVSSRTHNKSPANVQSCTTETVLFSDVLLMEVLQCEKKVGNRLVPGPDYVVDALKLPNQAPRVSGESLQTCVAWCCPDGKQHLFCWSNWPFLVNR
ncbi:hypothetical protein TNCV_1723251 [Trichonephila clavipes]|nr:hypothetical protein TNCV_1723251 [Trichonephila clavipes]